MATVKINDIARELNLATSTVSRALTGNGRVGEATRLRILEYAKEHGYRVNAVARSLRTNNAHNIGIVVPDISNPFFAEVIKGAQNYCRDKDYTLMFCNSDEDAHLENKALQLLLENRVSGLVISCIDKNNELIHTFETQGIPVVHIDNLPDNKEQHNCVSVDNERSGYQLAEMLLERGYRRFGMISGPKAQTSGLLRCAGVRACLRDNGLEICEDWWVHGDFKIESGYQNMKAILEKPELPEVMIFGNNYIAYGALRAIREFGLSVPKDLAVASFDTTDFTGLIIPCITTMNQPAVEIGRRAAEMIIHSSGSEDRSCENIELEPRLVIGESC